MVCWAEITFLFRLLFETAAFLGPLIKAVVSSCLVLAAGLLPALFLVVYSGFE